MSKEYCKNCKYYKNNWFGDEYDQPTYCKAPNIKVGYSHIAYSNEYSDVPWIRNKNNDCVDFKKKWWKLT